MRCAGHVIRNEDMRSAYKSLVANP